MDYIIFGIPIVAVSLFAWKPIQRAIDRRRTIDRLYRLCAVRNTHKALPRAEVRERANVA
jgi:hypothetical protein